MNAARNYKDDFARRYFVLRFDCSGLSSSDVQENFLAAVRGAAFDFTGRHGFDDAARFIDWEYANPTALIIDLLAKPHPHTKGGLLVVIDEYDLFSNEVLSGDIE